MKPFLYSICALAITAILTVSFKPSISNEVENKPNVVLILADDLGALDLAFAGSEFYETPNIDRLASQGVVFNSAYANSAVCSPARASIMTGQYTARHGITDWIGAKTGTAWQQSTNTKIIPPDYRRAIPSQNTTLAEAMKANGYKTFFAGKWHLGGEGNGPENNGFEINKGGWKKGRPVGGYYAPWNNPNLESGPNGQNLSMRLAQETSAFIESNKDTPFFAMLSFYAVHAPLQTTQEKWKKYRDKADKMGIAERGFEMERRLPIRTVQDHPVYAGLVETMDDAVGKVLETLASAGLAENTIIIFTSDHGGVASGDAYATSNLPLRGGKGYQWEGGLRVPLIISWPEKFASSVNSTAVSGADLYPTLLDLIDSKPSGNDILDGVSLKPLLTGNQFEPRPLFWHYPHYGNQGGDPTSIMTKGDYKFIYYWEDEKMEAYNIKTDIGEQTDISSDMPELTAQAEQRLMEWLNEVGAKFPVSNPNYNAEEAARKYAQSETTLLQQKEEQRKQFLSQNYKGNADWWGSNPTE